MPPRRASAETPAMPSISRACTPRDPALLTQLVRDLSPRIWVAIRRYARDDDDADDLLQDCWVQILERMDSFKRRGPFAAWAIAVSNNVCRMKLRREKLARSSAVALEDIPEIPDSGLDPLGELRARRERHAIYRALGKLPDRERDAIVLRVLEGRDTRGDGNDSRGCSGHGSLPPATRNVPFAEDGKNKGVACGMDGRMTHFDPPPGVLLSSTECVSCNPTALWKEGPNEKPA